MMRALAPITAITTAVTTTTDAIERRGLASGAPRG
jgi:hypothetical protein